MVQHNPLMDDCGMFATLQAAISVMVQINQFRTQLRPNFDHGIHFLSFAKNEHKWSRATKA
jgi:hypothetical protein